MKIRNIDLEFDFNDADDMEKLENAISEAQEKLNNMSVEAKKASEVIREGCQAIFDCFNKIFGENTDKKIFGNKTNFNICIEAFEDLVKGRALQEKEFDDKVKEIEKKYSPNRAIRRAKK